MSDELIERAEIIADATGRSVSDVLADLDDDGILNESNRNEKDLITQLKEAAELISTVQKINNEVSENTVLNGGDNRTEVMVETTLEGDIVDRAIESVHRKVQNIKKIAIIIIPVFLLLTGGTMSSMGLFSSDESPPEIHDEYSNDYGGCLNYDAQNYDPMASWDDGSCYWDDEPKPQPEPEPESCVGDLSAVSAKAEIYEGNSIEAHMRIALHNQCDTEVELMISFYYENGYQFSLEADDLPTYWIYGSETNLIIRHDSFTNLGDGNYSLETRFIPIGQSEECCIQTDTVWVNTEPEPEPEPEPQCNGTAFFYNVAETWFNETNETVSLQVSWDADWSCDETKQIEVDIFLKDSNGTSIYYGMPKYNITGELGDNKFVHIENLTKPTTGLRLCMMIYWQYEDSYYWSDEYNKTF